MLLDNKKLALILAVLTGLFLLVRWTKGEKNIRNFETTLFVLDTAQVNTIKLYPAVDNGLITFTRETSGWVVAKDQLRSTVAASQISSLLRSIVDIKPSRLAARNSDKWEQYQVTDSTGTRVILEDATGKSLADVMIGKFSYRQVPQQPGRQQGISGLTYIRKTMDEITFATEGFLSMTFNRDFNSFRDKSVIRSTPGQIKRLSFRTPSESFVLSNPGTGWSVGDQPADSAKVAQYLNGLQTVNGTTFNNQHQPGNSSAYQIVLSGDNMPDITVRADQTGAQFQLNSSLNPNAVFSSDSSGIFGKIFQPAAYFLPEPL